QPAGDARLARRTRCRMPLPAAVGYRRFPDGKRLRQGYLSLIRWQSQGPPGRSPALTGRPPRKRLPRDDAVAPSAGPPTHSNTSPGGDDTRAPLGRQVPGRRGLMPRSYWDHELTAPLPGNEVEVRSEEQVLAGPALEPVDRGVVVDRAGAQEVGAVEAAAAGDVGDPGGVVGIRPRPLRQQGGQGG